MKDVDLADRLNAPRADQVRYRRDHAKYLSLIAAVALLHQYQRERTLRGGKSCVVNWPNDFRRELAYTSSGGSWGVETEKASPRAK